MSTTCPASMHTPRCVMATVITETLRIQLVLFGMQNRTFDP
jgi:hypothetical protein